MKRAALALLLIVVALRAYSAKPVTVKQLEETLSAEHGHSDRKVAHRLAEIELSERLSSARGARLAAELPGDRSRQAFMLLADMSAFLDLPTDEVSATAAPDLEWQREIVAQAVDYAVRTMHKLPNLFATRETIFFKDDPPGRRADLSLIPYQPMHAASRSSDTVLYRDSQEVVDSGKQKRRKYDPEAESLITRGVFGPLMAIALVDASHGSLTWNHWEQGVNGPLAIFHFAVPKAMSHYEVSFCCLDESSGKRVKFDKISAYHGEIAIDVADGSILQLTIVADLEKSDPIVKSNILVEYGPVEIGGRNYICPLKSVSLWVHRRCTAMCARPC